MTARQEDIIHSKQYQAGVSAEMIPQGFLLFKIHWYRVNNGRLFFFFVNHLPGLLWPQGRRTYTLHTTGTQYKLVLELVWESSGCLMLQMHWHKGNNGREVVVVSESDADGRDVLFWQLQGEGGWIEKDHLRSILVLVLSSKNNKPWEKDLAGPVIIINFLSETANRIGESSTK